MKSCLLPRRRGFTILESMVALGILAVAMLLVAQVGYFALCERQGSAARQEALETAANILEAARGLAWEELTPAWAGRQKLPEHVAGRLRNGKLEVRVEPEASQPRMRRVTVEIRWSPEDDKPVRTVRLVALRSARAAPAAGESP
jgi:prepilin-type N-terminal cleavage/methylation domain-containing protein